MTLRSELIDHVTDDLRKVLAGTMSRERCEPLARIALDAILTRLRGELPEEMVEAGRISIGCRRDCFVSKITGGQVFHAMLGVLEEKG